MRSGTRLSKLSFLGDNYEFATHREIQMTQEEERSRKQALKKEGDEKMANYPVGLLEPSEGSLVWDEYKYRHDLIWKHLIRSTIAVIILVTVPYSTTLKSETLFNLGASVLAIGYIIFTIIVLKGELRLYKIIADIHGKRQHYLFTLHQLINSAEHGKVRRNGFSVKVYTYLGFLTVVVFVASFVNLSRAFFQ